MKKVAALLIVALAVSSSLVYAQSQTEEEVMQTIIESNAFTKANKKGQADAYSKHGALEFWSSGGLLQEMPPNGRTDEFDAFNLNPKHIRVITLVEGQAAVAHYYTEGSLTPKGAAPVGHYLTRVTQVFVKEDGKWKVRSSHWSAVTGGTGTTQTVLEN